MSIDVLTAPPAHLQGSGRLHVQLPADAGANIAANMRLVPGRSATMPLQGNRYASAYGFCRHDSRRHSPSPHLRRIYVLFKCHDLHHAVAIRGSNGPLA